jgi:hypothetical protein
MKPVPPIRAGPKEAWFPLQDPLAPVHMPVHTILEQRIYTPGFQFIVNTWKMNVAYTKKEQKEVNGWYENLSLMRYR